MQFGDVDVIILFGVCIPKAKLLTCVGYVHRKKTNASQRQRKSFGLFCEIEYLTHLIFTSRMSFMYGVLFAE